MNSYGFPNHCFCTIVWWARKRDFEIQQGLLSLAARYLHCGIDHEATYIVCRVIAFNGVTHHTIDLLKHQFADKLLAKIGKESDFAFNDSRIDLAVREASIYATHPSAILLKKPGR